MANIIVDGYNIIGTMHSDIEGERKALIKTLSDYRKHSGHDITIVYDGHKDGRSSSPTKTTSAGISVIYSPIGTNADKLIAEILSDQRTNWIVISSDREVQGYAWSAGSVPLDSETFMHKVAGPQSEEFDPDEDDGFALRGRGNPRKLSKKEMAQQRAIRKL